VQEPAEYPGGFTQLYSEIGKLIKYPVDCINNEIQGTVYLEFIVNKKGEISDITIKKGVHPKLDNEAARVLSLLKKWIPAKNNGTIVKTYYILPIKFRLN
jgi:periplasmic protein TonB